MVRDTFGDWQQRCETPAGAQQEQCGHRAERRGRGPAERHAARSSCSPPPTPEQKLLRVVAPLGVLLPAGLGLRVDGTDVGFGGLSCAASRTGCIAEVIMDQALVDLLSSGAEGDVHHLPDPPREGHRHPGVAERIRRGLFATLPGDGR